MREKERTLRVEGERHQLLYPSFLNHTHIMQVCMRENSVKIQKSTYLSNSRYTSEDLTIYNRKKRKQMPAIQSITHINRCVSFIMWLITAAMENQLILFQKSISKSPSFVNMHRTILPTRQNTNNHRRGAGPITMKQKWYVLTQTQVKNKLNICGEARNVNVS